MLIDLTYPIHNSMFKYASDSEPKIDITKAEFETTKKGFIHNEGGFCLGTTPDKKYKSGYLNLNIRNHHGTHIDAPSHKIPNGKTIDQYLLEKFINGCILIDLTQKDLMKRKKREITKTDLENSFPSNKQIGALIFYTGFCDEMSIREGRLSRDEKRDFEKTFPYFSKEAAEFIVSENPKLNIIGIDSFAVDPSGSNSEIHRIFFRKDILPLETLVNLKQLRDEVKRTPFKLVSAPLNYQGGDAAQVRAYAISNDN